MFTHAVGVHTCTEIIGVKAVKSVKVFSLKSVGMECPKVLSESVLDAVLSHFLSRARRG